MNKWFSVLRVVFVLVMLVCVGILIWQIPVSRSMPEQLREAYADLETARGRQRKQQAELNKAVVNIAEAMDVLRNVAQQQANSPTEQLASLSLNDSLVP